MGSMNARVALLLAAVVASASAGCRRPAARPTISQLSVADSPALTRLGAAGLALDEVRQSAAEGVGAALDTGIAPRGAKPDQGPFRAEVTVLFAHVLADSGEVDPLPSPTGKVEIGVEVELAQGLNQAPLRESAQWAERVDPAEGLAPALRRAVAGATRKCADALLLAWSEESKGDADVLADLQSKDARVRNLAVQVLADRKNPAAVPALIQRLQDPDGEVVERSIGALAQLGDRRAVGPLIEMSQRREPSTVAQLARIVGDLGGPEAEAYLVTLASGHPEPQVRQAAEAALAGMRGRTTAVAGRAPAPAP
jgi:hypothetical protein